MRQANAGESYHDYMRDVRLWNWGRAGRVNSDRPDCERGCSSIYQRGRADKQGEQTTADGEITNADEEAPDPIDHDDADSLDDWIKQLPSLYREIIRAKFYRMHQVLLSDVDAAVRALLDLMADNRRVVDVMKRMGWT